MAIKTKKITHRFHQQSIIIVLTIIIIMASLYFSDKHKQEAHQVIVHTKSLQYIGENMVSLTKEANMSQIMDPDFCERTAGLIIEENEKLSDKLHNGLLELSHVNIVEDNQQDAILIDSIAQNAALWQLKFEQYVLSLKMLGNMKGGIQAKILNTIESLDEELIGLHQALELHTELNSLKNNLVTTQSIRNIDDLLSYCSNLPIKLAEFNGDDEGRISEEVDNLVQLLDESKAIVLRLNADNESSQLYSLNTVGGHLLVNLDKLEGNMTAKLSRYFRGWGIAYIVVGSIIIFFLIYVSERLSLIIQKFLMHPLQVSDRMSKGDFTDEMGNKLKFEFAHLHNNLFQIREYVVERERFIRDLLNNQYDTDLVRLSEEDSLTTSLNMLRERLSEEQKQQEKQDEEVEIRRYINEGLAKFADIMRMNSQDTYALGDELIKNLVKYLGALQGGLFLTDQEDGQKINLISSFAFDRKKYLKKELLKGEGLVGTCAVEKKIINITEIPQDYISIKSGLGDTPPNNVLIVPVMNDKNLVGVIELASLKVFSGFEVNLAEQIAANLASTIITVRNNTRTASLLEKSQQQAAEMREQEEEMRQNMEELKATQEESSRRENEMQSLLKAVDSGFYQIEYNPDGQIEHVNAKLAAFLEQPLDSIIGKTHREIFSKNTLITEEVIHEIVEKKKTKNLKETLPLGNRELSYYHTLSPIQSGTGAVIKILNLLKVEEN